MFNPHIKFEMPTITCNEEMKGNAKCKNFRFEPPFGDLGVTHRVHLWLNGKRTVDFLSAISQLFSLVLTAAALLSEICRNQRFPGWVTLSANFRSMGSSPTIYLWTVRERNNVATTMLLEVFTQRNFAADFCRQKLKYTGKTAKLRFVPPFSGVRGNVHGSSMARWKARGRLPC